jgi:hypothetical protein
MCSYMFVWFVGPLPVFPSHSVHSAEDPLNCWKDNIDKDIDNLYDSLLKHAA